MEKAVKHFAQLDVAVLTKSMDLGDARFLRIIWYCEGTQDPFTDERTQENLRNAHILFSDDMLRLVRLIKMKFKAHLRI